MKEHLKSTSDHRPMDSTDLCSFNDDEEKREFFKSLEKRGKEFWLKKEAAASVSPAASSSQ